MHCPCDNEESSGGNCRDDEEDSDHEIKSNFDNESEERSDEDYDEDNLHPDLQEMSDDSESESESDEESDTQWQPKEEKKAISTLYSERRRVRLENEVERSIIIDSSIEKERVEEDAAEARSPSISADSSE